jgi:hypothetical protein
VPIGYTSLDWNADGSNGYSAQASDIFLNDTMTQVDSITLPTGSYVINASAWLENTSPTNSSSLGVCELVFGSAGAFNSLPWTIPPAVWLRSCSQFTASLS